MHTHDKDDDNNTTKPYPINIALAIGYNDPQKEGADSMTG